MDHVPIQASLTAAKNYSFAELCSKIYTIYAYNGFGAKNPQPHNLFMELADICPQSGGRSPTFMEAMNIIESFRISFNEQRELMMQAAQFFTNSNNEIYDAYLPLALGAGIINPDNEPRMMTYVLEKYEPFDDILFKKLGFHIKRLLKVVRFVELMMGSIVGDRFDSNDQYNEMRRGGSKHYDHEWEIPPTKFHSIIREALTVNVEEDYCSLTPESRNALDFLTGDQSNFGTNDYSFRRWAFLNLGNGCRMVLYPNSMVNTLLTAVQIGLLSITDFKEKGRFLQQIGKHFEKMVKDCLSSYLPTASITLNKKYPGQLSDTDLEVIANDNFHILVQCKSILPVQRVILDDQRSFADFYRKNVLEGAKQAEDSVNHHPDPQAVKAIFIVLDTYLPGLLTLQGLGMETSIFVNRLPTMIPMDYFGFRYLIHTIPIAELQEYLEWRSNAVQAKIKFTYDEYDMVRFYLRVKEEGLVKIFKDLFTMEHDMEISHTMSHIGYDPEWESNDYTSIDLKLGVFSV